MRASVPCAHERRSAAPASFEPAGRGAHSTTCTSRTGTARIGGTGAARPSRVRADRAHCVNRVRRIGRSRHLHRVGRARRAGGAPAVRPVARGSGSVRPAARPTGNTAWRHPPPAVLGAGGGALRDRS